MTSVNTNVGALVASENIKKVQNELDTAVERLSSGLRINSAKDDAAGVAISNTMEAQIRGLSQAVRNASDAQNLIDTTEGAHVEVTNLLQRLRELAVQSANDTNGALDRTYLNSEKTALVAEIDRIATQTTWNGSTVVDGTFSSKQFQLGSLAVQDITVSVDSTASSQIGNFAAEGEAAIYSGTTDTIAASTLTIAGFVGSSAITVAADASAKDVAASVNAATASTGVKAAAVTKARIEATAAGTFSLSIAGDGGTATAIGSVTLVNASDLTALKDAINAKSGTTGITAAMGADTSEVVLTHETGETIKFSSYASDSATKLTVSALTNLGAAGTSSGGTQVTLTDVDAANAAATAIINGHLSLNSSKTFTVDSSNSTTEENYFDAADPTASQSLVSGISLTTAANAEAAITTIDGAIDKINLARADLGAVSNRLDATISNLNNIITNTQESRAHIQDADFTAETSALTRAQILNQAATSMLAQANASKQSVLALLQQ